MNVFEIPTSPPQGEPTDGADNLCHPASFRPFGRCFSLFPATLARRNGETKARGVRPELCCVRKYADGEGETEEQRGRGRTRRRRNGVNSRISAPKMGICTENSARTAWLCLFLPSVLSFLFFLPVPNPSAWRFVWGTLEVGEVRAVLAGGFLAPLLPAQRSS